MNDKDFRVYVQDMLEAIDKILKYIDTVQTFEEFKKNDMVVDAVTRNYEIIGEASNRVPTEIKEKYSNIPWRQMYGLRNFAVHEYHIIDPRILWEIAEDHLIENRNQLEELLSKEN